MKNLFLIISCLGIVTLLTPFEGRSQNPVIDSLEKKLQETHSPLERGELLNDLARKISFSNFPQSIAYGEEALGLAQAVGNKELERDSYYNMGRIYASHTNAKLAKEYGYKALDLAKEIGDKKSLTNCYILLGGALGLNEELDLAFQSYLKARDFAEELNNERHLGSIYNNIGYIFKAKEDYENARKYFLLALPIFEKLNHKRFLVNVYNNLALSTEDADESIAYVEKALAVVETTPENLFGKSYTLLNLGQLYLDKKKDYHRSLKYHRAALEVDQKINAPSGIFQNKYGIGSCFMGLNQLDSAAWYLEAALKGFKEIEYLDGNKLANFRLAEIYQKQGKSDLAYSNLLASYQLKDSLYNEETARALAKNNALLQAEQRDREIAEQELEIIRQKQLRSYFIITGLILLALMASFFQYFLFRQKQKKQAAELALQAQQQEAERLREVDQLKSSFFTNISHELRTPLTLVAAPLDDALQNVKPGLLKNHLQLAQSNTQKLLGLVNEILDLSKLEAGKIKTQDTAIDLLPFCRRIFYSFESVAELRSIQLNFESTIAESFHLQSDAEKLEKILNNLLSNAIKFTPTDGSIHMQLQQEKDQLFLIVKDTGSGIAPEELPRIFDRFYQSTAPSAPLQGGTGIGLSLAKELAQLLGGDLLVESTLGKGTAFTLQIPAKAASESQETPSSQVESTDVEKTPFPATYAQLFLNGKKPRLLIVEDNPEMSQYLVQSLSPNYHCTTAPNGQVALSKLQEQSFDLITSDVMMPTMDGFAFREQVNTNPAWRQIPFVMLTARALEVDKLRGFQLGVDDYLTKPFSRKELEARIHNLLSNKIERDAYQQEESVEEEVALNAEEQLLKNAEAYVLKRLDDPQLRVEDLAKELHYSSRQLSRVFRKICGLTPVNFILELRMQKARQLLESRRFQTVAEVRYAVGIESASYFTTKFTARFGKGPKEYLL